MATGTGLGSLIPVALSVLGIVTMLRNRANRRAGRRPADADHERRQLAAAEMERRMASYLAGRNAGGGTNAAIDPDEQENQR